MDTACPFPYVAGTDPAPDCCRQAASALRSVLASSGWERVASVHNPLILSRPDFVAAIDLSWRWLDPHGQPLA